MKKTLLLCCFFPLFLTAQEVEWARFINGAGEEFFDAIATDTEGNIYGGGSFDGSISFDGDADLALGTSDGFLFKASPDGEILWNIVLGGFGTGRVSDIQFADNGDLLVSGYFTEELLFGNQTILSAGQNEWHAFILWITTDGELAQAAQVPCSGLLQTRHFFQAKDGGYYLAGEFRGTLEYGGLTLENAPAGYPGLFVLKLSPQLNVVWHKQFRADAVARIEGMTEGPDEGIFLAAEYDGQLFLEGSNLTLDASSDISLDGVLLKFDKFGQLLWHQVVSGQGLTSFSSLSVDPYGEVYLTGVFAQEILLDTYNVRPNQAFNLFICKLQDDGAPKWLFTYSNEAYNSGVCIQASPAGGFWLSGLYGGDFSLGGIPLDATGEPSDGFLAKFSDDGTARWVQTINGPDSDYMGRFAAHPDGQLYGIGTFRSSTRIEGFQGNAQDERDIVAFKIDCPVNKPVVTQNGNIVFTTENYAAYQWYKDGSPIPGNGAAATAQSPGRYQVAVESFTGCVTISDPAEVMVSAEETIGQGQLKVFPNPVQGELHVQLPEAPSGQGWMRLSLPTGERIMEGPVRSVQETFSFSGLPAGLFILEVFSGNKRWVTRVIH